MQRCLPSVSISKHSPDKSFGTVLAFLYAPIQHRAWFLMAAAIQRTSVNQVRTRTPIPPLNNPLPCFIWCKTLFCIVQKSKTICFFVSEHRYQAFQNDTDYNYHYRLGRYAQYILTMRSLKQSFQNH